MIKRLTYLILFSSLIFGCKEEEVIPQKTTDTPVNEHLTLGNPSNATSDVNNSNNYLIERPQYVLSSGDRTRTEEDNSATFLMTNMIPQAPANNRETWGTLEQYTRTLVDKGNEVYVIMGSYGKGGTGSNGYAETIDQGRITVPKQIWKVIVVLPEGDNDLNRISTTTRVIAVNTPNINTVNPAWGTYRTTVDAIETVTGYNLLSELPDNIENALESKVDSGPTF